MKKKNKRLLMLYVFDNNLCGDKVCWPNISAQAHQVHMPLICDQYKNYWLIHLTIECAYWTWIERHFLFWLLEHKTEFILFFFLLSNKNHGLHNIAVNATFDNQQKSFNYSSGKNWWTNYKSHPIFLSLCFVWSIEWTNILSKNDAIMNDIN